MGFDRYKYVVTVLIVEKAGQAINVSKHIIYNIFRILGLYVLSLAFFYVQQCNERWSWSC